MDMSTQRAVTDRNGVIWVATVEGFGTIVGSGPLQSAITFKSAVTHELKRAHAVLDRGTFNGVTDERLLELLDSAKPVRSE